MKLSVMISAPFPQNTSTRFSSSILKKLKANGMPLISRCIGARAASEEASFSKVKQAGKWQPVKTAPKLFKVPALPFFGSLVTMQSGFSQWNSHQPYSHFLLNRENLAIFTPG
jgi:hypothetical protein